MGWIGVEAEIGEAAVQVIVELGSAVRVLPAVSGEVSTGEKHRAYTKVPPQAGEAGEHFPARADGTEPGVDGIGGRAITVGKQSTRGLVNDAFVVWGRVSEGSAVDEAGGLPVQDLYGRLSGAEAKSCCTSRGMGSLDPQTCSSGTSVGVSGLVRWAGLSGAVGCAGSES